MAVLYVYCMLLQLLQLAIYILIKPQQRLIFQFFGVIVICQTFNLDHFSSTFCALCGCLCLSLEQLVQLCRVPDALDTHESDPFIPSFSFLFIKLASLYTWSLWSWMSGQYWFTIAFQVQSTATWVQLLVYLWANRILVGEPLLPYERQQMLSKNTDGNISPDLEQLMHINQS